MGGCKCSFRNCNIPNLTDEKIRYFHFPIKDRSRLEQWIVNAEKPQFHALPIQKLRNKVVCQYHFESRYFMNDKQDRLTHNAVPTIDPSGDNRSSLLSDIQVIPIENIKNEQVYNDNSTDFAVVSVKNEQINHSSNVSAKINLDLNQAQTLDDLSLIPVGGGRSSFLISSSPFVPAKPPKQRVKVNVKNIMMPYKRQTKRPERIEHHFRDNENDSCITQSNSEYCSYKVTANGEIVISNKQTTELNCDFVDDDIQLESQDTNTYSICIGNKKRKHQFEHITIDNEDELLGCQQRNDPLRIQNQQNEAQNQTDVNNQEGKNKKISRRARRNIIYNHVSRHVNPIMAMALKMELFNKKDWDAKERRLAVDLYQSTPEGYQVLLENWGFKLPPLELVQQWIDD